MSGGRRQMLMYEQRDGTFRIPPGMTVCMGLGVDTLQSNVIEGHPLSTPIKISPLQRQDDAIAHLQYENQYYKNKYLTCLKQLQDFHELNLLISRRMELALQTNGLAVQLLTSTSSTPGVVDNEAKQILFGNQIHTLVAEAACPSGSGAMVPKEDKSARSPPKKRLRRGTGTADLFA